ncbi:MAG: hypothetical protein SYC29_08315 [Planctomycetota bacterium]|nr:hypothetical protein [Planctomycetota bacterium]
MYRMTSLLILAAVLSGFQFARAAHQNAATWYWRAIERLPRLTDDDWAQVSRYADDPSGAPSPELRAALAKAGPIIDAIRRGARREQVFFDAGGAEEFESLLGPLANIQRAARLLRADALVHLHDGDPTGAADRLASIYHLSDDLGAYGIVTGSLVAQATFKLADDTVQLGFDRAEFSRNEAAELYRAARSFDDRDPFGMLESLASQQELVLSWLDGGEDGGSLHAADLARWTRDDGLAAQVAVMTDSEIHHALDQYDHCMDQIVEAFALDDRAAARAELERIAEEIGDGSYGPFAEGLGSMIVKIFDLTCRDRDRVEARREMLREIVTGETDPLEFSNAAIFYARAIEQLRALGADRVSLIRAFVVERPETADPELTETLRLAEPVVELLREGSSKKRCDFSILPQPPASSFCPDYVAGLHDAFHLLHGKAIVEERAGDATSMVDTLTISLRIIAHLGGEDSMLSPLVAHRAFDGTMQLALENLETGLLREAGVADLLAAAAQISKSDPFGYVGSLVAGRDTVAGLIHRCRPDAQEPAEAVSAIREVTERWDGDRLLYFLIIFDTMRRAGEADHANDGGDHLELISGLGDVLSPAQLEKARNETATVAPLIIRGDLNELSRRPVSHVSDISARARSARRDLRRAIAQLREAD